MILTIIGGVIGFLLLTVVVIGFIKAFIAGMRWVINAFRSYPKLMAGRAVILLSLLTLTYIVFQLSYSWLCDVFMWLCIIIILLFSFLDGIWNFINDLQKSPKWTIVVIFIVIGTSLLISSTMSYMSYI